MHVGPFWCMDFNPLWLAGAYTSMRALGGMADPALIAVVTQAIN